MGTTLSLRHQETRPCSYSERSQLPDRPAPEGRGGPRGVWGTGWKAAERGMWAGSSVTRAEWHRRERGGGQPRAYRGLMLSAISELGLSWGERLNRWPVVLTRSTVCALELSPTQHPQRPAGDTALHLPQRPEGTAPGFLRKSQKCPAKLLVFSCLGAVFSTNRRSQQERTPATCFWGGAVRKGVRVPGPPKCGWGAHSGTWATPDSRCSWKPSLRWGRVRAQRV